MYCVYVLQSLKDGFLYIGTTSDLENRIKRHNAGYEKATKRRIPFKLLHQEIFPTRLEARDREKYLKSGFGREIIRSLLVK
jgi:putative endonuclease